MPNPNDSEKVPHNNTVIMSDIFWSPWHLWLFSFFAGGGSTFLFCCRERTRFMKICATSWEVLAYVSRNVHPKFGCEFLETSGQRCGLLPWNFSLQHIIAFNINEHEYHDVRIYWWNTSNRSKVDREAMEYTRMALTKIQIRKKGIKLKTSQLTEPIDHDMPHM